MAAPVIRRLLIVIATVAAMVATAAQPSDPGMTISGAEDTTFDLASGESVMRGRVVISDAGLLFEADLVRHNRNTDIVTATGHVVLTLIPDQIASENALAGGARLLADRLVYNRRTQSFTAGNIRFGSYPVFVEGFRGYEPADYDRACPQHFRRAQPMAADVLCRPRDLRAWPAAPHGRRVARDWRGAAHFARPL